MQSSLLFNHEFIPAEQLTVFDKVLSLAPKQISSATSALAQIDSTTSALPLNSRPSLVHPLDRRAIHRVVGAEQQDMRAAYGQLQVVCESLHHQLGRLPNGSLNTWLKILDTDSQVRL